MAFLEWEALVRLCHGGDQAGATVLSMQAPKAGGISNSGPSSVYLPVPWLAWPLLCPPLLGTWVPHMLRMCLPAGKGLVSS